MKFLGVDYGSKRIGVAISDEDCRFAFPKEIMENDGAVPERISKIIQNEDIRGVVIGESLDFAGQPNAIMQEVKTFAEKIKSRIEVPVYFEKEFLTTVEARRYQEKEEKADARAAALILQRYLDRKNKQS